MVSSRSSDRPDLEDPVRLSPSRSVLALALAGGLAATGTGIAYAASPSPAPSAGSTAPAPPPPPRSSAADTDGRVTSVSDSSLTVTDPSGQARTYALDSSTTVHRGPDQLRRSDLRSGLRVHVRGSGSGSTLRAVDVDLRPAHLDGTVTALSSDRITLVDREGFTRQVSTGSSTTYGDGGRSALRVGGPVHAEGTVDPDGTTLDATRVTAQAGPKPGGPRPGPGAAGGPAGGPAGPGAGPRAGGRPKAVPGGPGAGRAGAAQPSAPAAPGGSGASGGGATTTPSPVGGS